MSNSAFPEVICSFNTVISKDGFLKEEKLVGIDDNSKEWDLGKIRYFIINLIDINKDIDFSRENLETEKINEILNDLYKSKNLNLKDELVLYIDYIETNEYVRRTGMGTRLINHIKNVAKDNCCRAVVLNAMPITSSDLKSRNPKEYSKRKDNLHFFYLKRGFVNISKTKSKTKNIMFYRV